MKKNILFLILLAVLMDAFPQSKSYLGPISVEVQQPMKAMVAYGSGTMETMGEQLGMLYGLIMAEVSKQNLEVAGPPFVQYYDFDEASGFSSYVAGIPVLNTGEAAGKVHSLSYGKMNVVQALHTGPYQELATSYNKIDQYVKSDSLEVSGQAFEFYLTDPTTEPDSSKWQTLISFLLQ